MKDSLKQHKWTIHWSIFVLLIVLFVLTAIFYENRIWVGNVLQTQGTVIGIYLTIIIFLFSKEDSDKQFREHLEELQKLNLKQIQAVQSSTQQQVTTLQELNGKQIEALQSSTEKQIYTLQDLHYLRGRGLAEEMGDVYGVSHVLCGIGNVYFLQKKYALARSFFDSSLVLAKKSGFPELIRNSEFRLGKTDSVQGNAAGAFEHYKQYILYRDSISNNETRKAIMKSQLKYEFEKKEAVMKEHQEKERAVAEEKNRRQQIVIWAVACGLLLVVLFSAVVFRTLKTTRRQKIIIEEKQKDILASIRYAERIQTSLLPTEKHIDKMLSRSKTDVGQKKD